MMEHKRSPVSIEQSSPASLTPKRHKADDISISSKERKEKVGERIAALQQLVSPFGKVKAVKPSTLYSSDSPFDTQHCDRTDTASVLLEAMGYISFLHEQVKVLSAPYLHSTSLEIIQGSESFNLRSKGLCLVPISCTAGVASTNGADIWAPTKSVSPKY